MCFSVSVIIPVFNCEAFIEKAITSALQQTEVFEVIVVNDGSTDSTEITIERLQKQNSKIKLLHHKNKINKGRSASRNLGIKNATGNYIAFLDADDYYLEDRFKNDKHVFQNQPSAHGVYNAVGFHYYRNIQEFEKKSFKLNTVTQIVNPECLFEALLSGKFGYIHLNGLTLKKGVFNLIGVFNESLIVAEDSDLIFKMALKCRLFSGIIDTEKARRGIHNSNIFNNSALYQIYNIKMYESIFIWSGKHNLPIKNIDILLKWIYILKYKEEHGILNYITHWASLFFVTPKWLFTYLSLKYFPIVRLRQKLFPFLFKIN